MSITERPDSARSWAIASAGFVINFLLSGVSRSTGLLYVAIIETYGISRMEANFPFTLRSIFRNLLGPLVGVIGQRYGAREVTIIGGFLAAIGVGSCFFASDIVWISILWGGIYGTGVALGNTLFQVIVNHYFEKYRATASGFSFSGACVGSFAFPIVFEYLLANIGLSGTFLLTGGLMLHVVPAGMLMKEPIWIKRETKVSLQKNVDHSSVQSEKKFISEKYSETSEDIFAIAYKRISSTHDIFSNIRQHTRTLKNEEFLKDGACNPSFQEDFGEKTPVEKLKNEDTASPLSENNFTIYRGTMHMICDPMFHIISLSLAALILLFDICITIIIDYLKDKGISEEDGKYFIIMISAGDFVGRLGFGWVTDRNYLSLSKYMMLLQIIQGSCFGLMAFFNSFNYLIFLVVACSMASGASTVMYPILVANYLPSVQSLAIGFTCFTGGLVAFGVPPMIGYFRDTIGSYDSLYLVIGAYAILTGLLWGLQPLFAKRRRKTGRMIENGSTQMTPQDSKI